MKSLIGELLDDATTLFRQELRLAQAEMAQKVSRAANASLTVMAGLMMAFGALLVLLQALVFGLSNLVAPWLAAAIVSTTCALVALVLIRVGQSHLRPQAHLLDKAQKSNQQKESEMEKTS